MCDIQDKDKKMYFSKVNIDHDQAYQDKKKESSTNKSRVCAEEEEEKKTEEYNYDMEAERREKNGPKNIIVQNERESWFLKQKPVTPDIIVRQKKKRRVPIY